MNALRFAAILFAIGTVSAQTAVPDAAPHVSIETVGPDGWRVRFGPTNLGGLLESEQGRGMWQPQMLPLLGMWQQMAGDETTFAAAKGRLLSYGGRVRLAVWMQAAPLERPMVQRLIVVLEGDGRTDMKTLAADVHQLQKQLPGEWNTTELGGAPVQTLHQDGDALTAPVLVGQHLVIALDRSDQLSAAFAAATTMANAATGKPPAPTTPAFHLDIDAAALVARANKVGNEHENKAVQIFGLDSLARAHFTIGTAGPHLQFEVSQHFPTGPRGLFAAFCPPVQEVPTLQRAVTDKLGAWRIGHFDFRACYDTIWAAVQVLGDMDPAEMKKDMQAELGIDVGTDLIAHLTNEVLLLGSPLAGLDRPSEFSWTLAVRLRDAKAFGTSLDTLLQKSKPMLSREEPTMVDGVELKRYGNMFGYDLWFAVAHDHFLFAGGRDAEEYLTKSLAALKASADTKLASTAATTAFANLTKALPAGLNGLARGDLDTLFAVPTDWWLMILGELLPFPAPQTDDDPEQRASTRALLKQHNLSVLRTATGFADGTWRWRVYW